MSAVGIRREDQRIMIKNGIEYLYMIHSKQGTTFQPIYKTEAQAKINKRLIFTNEKDFKEAWIEELIVAVQIKCQ